MISTRILCRPFVGRAEELEHLKLRRRQAGDGHGGLVLIGGEPGIGKSRLAGEFRERLNRRTSFVAASACREFAERPLRPILEILEKISEVRANDLVLSNKSDWLATIADAFERVAKRTTVVVIEDLHWADVDLVQTLLVLARRAANKRLLFVATYRDNELSPTHPLFKWFGQLLREPAVSSIRLPRFENRELDRLMAHAIEGSASLSPPLLHAVRDRADGNPLFAEELLRSAVDAQRAGLAASPAALPISLHALVAERLEECSSEVTLAAAPRVALRAQLCRRANLRDLWWRGPATATGARATLRVANDRRRRPRAWRLPLSARAHARRDLRRDSFRRAVLLAPEDRRTSRAIGRRSRSSGSCGPLIFGRGDGASARPCITSLPATRRWRSSRTTTRRLFISAPLRGSSPTSPQAREPARMRLAR